MKLSSLIDASSLQATDALPGIQTVGDKYVPRRFTLATLAAYFGVSGGGSGFVDLDGGTASGVTGSVMDLDGGNVSG